MSVVRAGKGSAQTAKVASFALAISTVLGALCVLLFVTMEERWIGLLFAFSAGSSVYVGASDLIPEINKTRGRRAPLLVFLGMILFWLGKYFITLAFGKY
jgi:zinc transporter ZupT